MVISDSVPLAPGMYSDSVPICITTLYLAGGAGDVSSLTILKY